MVERIRNPKLFGNDFLSAGVESIYFDPAYAKQKQANLCWAASIEMAARYYGLPISQDYFASNHCGVDFWGNPKDCPASMDIITKNLNQCFVTHCIEATHFSGSPEAKDLFELLKNNMPVIVAYNTGNPIGHAVLITAISFEKTVFGDVPHSITVRDPDPNPLNQLGRGKKVYTADSFLPLIHSWWVPVVTKHERPRPSFQSYQSYFY
jgi:hypothetical protein